MFLLDLTLSTLAENLALDEALLDESEAAREPLEVLRLWESPETAVIVGRASRLHSEVNVAACRQDGVPILRRSSGGCAVVVGPGCLMYAAVLSYELRPALRMLDEAHRFVMERLQYALAAVDPPVRFNGTCDLTWQGRKFSGNSLRCKRTHLLYHGTLLYEFPLEHIARYLRTPPRQPEYRQGRSHGEFVTNVPAPPHSLRDALAQAFNALESLADWPQERMRQLVLDRYSQAAWHEDR